MLRTRTTSKGQAVTEMAVFGSFILVGFAVLLSHAQTFTENQALKQQAFRMALSKAYTDNGFVSYNILKNPRNVSPSSNFKERERSSISAASSVLWSKGEAESRSYYQINEDQIEIPRFEKNDVDTPAEVWDVQTTSQNNYSGSEERQEDNVGINTTRSAWLQDTVTTTLKLRYQTTEDEEGHFQDAPDQVLVQGLGENGRYSQEANSTVVSRTRKWETPHP